MRTEESGQIQGGRIVQRQREDGFLGEGKKEGEVPTSGRVQTERVEVPTNELSEWCPLDLDCLPPPTLSKSGLSFNQKEGRSLQVREAGDQPTSRNSQSPPPEDDLIVSESE